MKRAISAQGTKMYIENPNSPAEASGTANAGTKSAPCVVTLSDVTNLGDGDPVTISGSGWPSIDGRKWTLSNLDVDAKTAELTNSDTSSEVSQWNATAAFSRAAFADVCAVSYQINQNPAADIDTTTLCDTQKTSLVGFRDPGELTFDFFIDPSDPDYQALLDAYDDGEERVFKIEYRNGATRTLPVIVQSINESGGVDQAIQGSATLRIAGAPVLTVPAIATGSGTSRDASVARRSSPSGRSSKTCASVAA